MALRKYKPTSPGRRFMTVSTFEEITKTEPEKSLLEPLKKTGGRNSYGRITTRHQGGGHKRRYRIIDFKRTKDAVPAKVAAIEYDPNRSARIALLHYADGAKSYILAPARLRVGAVVESGPNADIRPGNALPLANIPTGTVVHNVELKPGKWRPDGAQRRLRHPAGREGRRATASCAFPRARCAASRSPAARPSGRSGTPTTRTSPAARPAGAAGRASVRPSAGRR